MQHVLVIGGGICGLATALGFARAGRRVTIIDREPPPPTTEPHEAFALWTRASVPQARQGHFFYARTRNVLHERAPDVLERLVACGAGRWNTMDLAQPEQRIPEDEQLTGLRIRRLPFELILRRSVEAEPLAEILHSSVAEGLLISGDVHDMPLVSGVRLRDGAELAADLVIDACGRKTPVPGWLARRGASVDVEVEDCHCVYYGRYFQLLDGCGLDPETDVPTKTIGGDLGYLSFVVGFTESYTLGTWINAPSWDKEMKALRDPRAWDAAAHSFPAWAPWIDPDNAVALTPVMPFAGQKNVLRRYVSGDRPIVRGLLPVGDALSMTNPTYGWGVSLGLTHAFAAVDAACAHSDAAEVLSAYLEAVMPEVEARYETSATADRILAYRRRGEGAPEEDRLAAERDQLLRDGLGPATRRDVDVLRAMTRRGQLVDPPDAIWSNEPVLATAHEVMAWRREHGKTSRAEGPDRGELLEIMSAALRN